MLRFFGQISWVWVLMAVLPNTPAMADIVTLTASEDTAPYSFLPNLPRFNNPSLYAFDTVSEEGTNHLFETYLWFDVSAADIPAGQVLTEALLVVTYGFDFAGFGETSSDPGELDCHPVAEAWDDTNLTWSNRPAIDPAFDTITQIDAFGALICDASSVVANWIYGPGTNHGFALTSGTERVMGMYSLEADVADALKPTLILSTEVPEPGFGIALAIGSLAIAAQDRRRSRSAWLFPR